MNDLSWTNVWLAVLATISLIEFLMIAAAGLIAFKMYKQVMTTIENVERLHIAPLRARVDSLLDEVQSITDKVKRAQESVSHVFETAAGAGSLLATTMKAKARPVLGILNGVRFAAATLLKNGKDQPRSIAECNP